jgi:periplasmic protein TonB
MITTLTIRAATVAAAALLLISCASANVPADVVAPRVLERVEPEYPEDLRAARVEGTVVISGIVPKEGGRLQDPKVERSDDARLSSFALDAVSRWKFQPGTVKGEPTDVLFEVTIRFSVDR